MATAFIDSRRTTRIRIPPAATVWNSALGLLGVIVDLDRQRGVAVARPPGQPEDRPGGADHQERGGLADRPRQAEDRAGQDARQRDGQDVVADHLPAGRAQRQRGLAERVRHGPQRLLRGDDDDRQDQQAERQPAGPERRPQRQALHAERPHEQRQAEDAVDDRRHPGEVGDVRLDEPAEPARRGVLLQEDRRADADRDARTRPPGPAARGSRRSRSGTRPAPGRATATCVTSAVRNANRSRVLLATSYQEWLPGRWSTAAMIDPSSTESTTTPVSVARKHATPKTGPASTRIRRWGSYREEAGRLIDRPRDSGATPVPTGC